MKAKYFHPFTQVLAVNRTACGVELEVDPEFRERLRIDVVRDDVIRLKMSRRRVFDETPTFAVATDLEAATPPFSVEETDGFVRVRTARLISTVFKHTFGIEAHRPDGAFRRTRFILRRQGDRVTLETPVTGNGYPAFRRTEFVLHCYGLVDGSVTTACVFTDVHDGRMHFANAGESFDLMIDLTKN